MDHYLFNKVQILKGNGENRESCIIVAITCTFKSRLKQSSAKWRLKIQKISSYRYSGALSTACCHFKSWSSSEVGTLCKSFTLIDFFLLEEMLQPIAPHITNHLTITKKLPPYQKSQYLG